MQQLQQIPCSWGCPVFHTVRSLTEDRSGRTPGLTKSRPHDRTTTAQSRRPRSPTARTSYLSDYDRTPIISSRLCGIVRPHIATAHQMMYDFHGPLIYYNRICIGVKNNPN